jgi:hypothetical protein
LNSACTEERAVFLIVTIKSYKIRGITNEKQINGKGRPGICSHSHPVWINALNGGVTTLGVVALNGGRAIGKMKCALVGVWAGDGDGLDLPGIGKLPKFTHTISCDDADLSEAGEVHSQLTFDTSGSFTGYDGFTSVSFIEHSEPKAGTGKGVFENTTEGQLDIDGTLNFATGSIDMSFTGEVCMGD